MELDQRITHLQKIKQEILKEAYKKTATPYQSYNQVIKSEFYKDMEAYAKKVQGDPYKLTPPAKSALGQWVDVGPNSGSFTVTFDGPNTFDYKIVQRPPLVAPGEVEAATPWMVVDVDQPL